MAEMNIDRIEKRFDSTFEDDRDLAEWAREYGSELIEYVSLCRDFLDEYEDWILKGNDLLDEGELAVAMKRFQK